MVEDKIRKQREHTDYKMDEVLPCHGLHRLKHKAENRSGTTGPQIPTIYRIRARHTQRLLKNKTGGDNSELK